MSKTPNPVRGHVLCPVCSCASTVHMVGEGKLIDTGESVKNARNLGLLYYKCPSCGNSSMSKSVSEYCTSNMVDSPDLLQATVKAVESEQLSVTDQAKESVTPEQVASLETCIDSTEVPALEPALSTETPTPSKPSFKPQLVKVAACLGLVVVLLFTIKRLLAAPKPELEEQVNG
ncbi:hypothetical protein LC147_18380 [Vibrio harveyi]|uniref:hypothetical protein n=1 Tax=Vibrio harveyi TaxID=669 RepID=UPI003BB58FEF